MFLIPRPFIPVCFLLLIFAAFAGAQETQLKPKELPPPVLTVFYAAYPNAKITGASAELEDSLIFYEIACKEGKIKRDVTYTAEGNVVSVETIMPFTELPLPVRNALAATYPNAKIRKSESIVKSGITTYEVLLKNEGKFIELVMTPYGKITETEDKGKKPD